MSEDRKTDNYEDLASAYASIAPQWPGLVVRGRQEPPVPKGKPSFWWAKELEPWTCKTAGAP